MRNVIYRIDPSLRSRPADPPDTVFFCDRCHTLQPVTHDGGTGYARRNDGTLICYACCAGVDRDDTRKQGRTVLYFDGKTITNWPGTLTFPVRYVRRFNHPFARRAWCGEFVGPDGKLWRFKNIGDSQIAHCRIAA